MPAQKYVSRCRSLELSRVRVRGALQAVEAAAARAVTMAKAEEDQKRKDIKARRTAERTQAAQARLPSLAHSRSNSPRLFNSRPRPNRT